MRRGRGVEEQRPLRLATARLSPGCTKLRMGLLLRW
jgi:hypothetical protein